MYTILSEKHNVLRMGSTPEISLLAFIILELFFKNFAFAIVAPTSSRLSTGGWSPNSAAEQEQSCKCNMTEVFTQLPYLIQAIGMDDRTKFHFRGEPGERGIEGPEGPQGLQGFPGRGIVGPAGRDGQSIRGEKGSPGAIGDIGMKGQKGEVAPSVYMKRYLDGSVHEVKGQKGDMGRRGRKGNRGISGIPGISIQGEKGEPCELPDLSELRGPPGLRGPVGPVGKRAICRTCQHDNKDSYGPIYIPMQGNPGPPGLAVVGQKGEPGERGPMSTQELGSLPLQFSNEEHLKGSPTHPVGTLAFTTNDETFFIFTRRGWREVELGRFLSAVDYRTHRAHPRDWNRIP